MNEIGAMPSLPSPAEEFTFVFSSLGQGRVLQEALNTSDPLGWHRFAPMEMRVRPVVAQITQKPKAKRRKPKLKAKKRKAGAEAQPANGEGDEEQGGEPRQVLYFALTRRPLRKVL